MSAIEPSEKRFRLTALGTSRALKPTWFAAGFALASLAALVITIRAAASGDLLGENSLALVVAALVNIALILGLAGFLGLRLMRTVRATSRDEPAPRLHVQFVMMLGIGAVVPAVISAVILGLVFFRFIDAWFSQRVEQVVQSTANIARTYLQVESRLLSLELRGMARDLNQSEAASALANHRITYVNYLREQTTLRGFEAAYVIDRSGVVLARAEGEAPPPFVSPSQAYFLEADGGGMPFSLDRTDGRIRVLFRLENYEEAYVYVSHGLGEGTMAQLNAAEEAVVAYRQADEERGQTRTLLGIIYLQWAALATLGAAWFGMSAANRFVSPIGRLVRAAERVRDGDMGARVFLDDRRDELAMLGRAFNEMTGQLASQRTDLIAASDDAERRRQFTAAVLSGVSAGVIGVDAAGVVTHVNRSASPLLGLDRETDLIGQEATVALPEFAGLFVEARASRSVVSAQIDLEREGRIRNLNVRASSSKDGSGAIVVTFDDITRLISAQRNAAWRDVARRIAHEIKNPLTPIQLSAQRLRRKYRHEVVSDTEIFERCTETIERKVAEIRNMVDEFSAFARMPAPKLETVDLSELVRSTVFAERVAAPDVSFEVEAPEDPVFTTCDERLIAQALANVVKNAGEAVAERYAEEDPGAREGAGCVETVLTVRGGQAVIEVRDNGVGWPLAERDRLMEPYMTTRERGTGLGLAIVSRVMEDHHGGLELDDRADGGRGAVVRLSLPIRDAEETARAATSSQ